MAASFRFVGGLRASELSDSWLLGSHHGLPTESHAAGNEYPRNSIDRSMNDINVISINGINGKGKQ
jgi:hypothetical protein